MKSTDFFGKIASKYLWGNIMAMIFVVILLCIGVKIGLDAYTHHGEAIIIPNIRHKSSAEAERILERQGLKMVVTDTGYVKTLPPDCILEQTPGQGNRVKSGHIIYVIVNSSHSPTIALPDIIDNSSLREAKARLIAMGFKVGEPEYIPGEKEWVYGVKAGGRNVNAGDRVSVDERLTIIVGDGTRDETDSVDYIDPVYRETEELETVEEPVEEEPEKDEFEVVNGPA